MIDRIPVPNFFGWDGPSTFSILMMLAFLTASYMLPKEFKRKGLEPSHSDTMILLGIIGTLIGAKVFFIFEIWDQVFVNSPGFEGRFLYPITHWYGFPGQPGLWSSLFSGGGLVFYGGFLTGFLFVYLFMKSKGLNYGLYFDAVVPSMSIGYAIGRLGCFISGDGCYGFATDVEIPLLVFNYHGAHPSGVPVWNTPVMESIMAFGYFAYFQYWAKLQGFRKYSLTCQFLIIHGAARLAIEFLRVNKAMIPFIDPPQMSNIPDSSQNPEFLTGYYWHGFSQSQYISIALIAFGIFYFIKGKLWIRDSKNEVPLTEPKAS
jgi:phosphatidylglycerol:prolipoprotein diacylglycerol transferase